MSEMDHFMTEVGTSVKDPATIDSLRQTLYHQGFVHIPRHLWCLSATQVEALRHELDRLFVQGQYDTGLYPDEIHWRRGISHEHATRELCNAWKASFCISRVMTSASLGELACQLADWPSCRLAQDDVIHKPPQGGAVGFHQDSTYISNNFQPRDNNSLTLWMALDDADEENGALQYAVSHLWKTNANAEGGSLGKENDDKSLGDMFHAGHGNHLEVVHRAAVKAGLGIPDDLEIQTVKVQAGDLLVHHQDVWHGSAPNCSATRHRRAVVAHVLRGDVKWHVPPTKKENGPDRLPNYIYGRYFIRGEQVPRQDFFPTIYGKDRPEWLDRNH